MRHALLDSVPLARAEPGLRRPMAGALHWLDPWSVNDPGALVARYARRFAELGGQVVEADASGLRRVGGGWQVQTAAGPLAARHAVVALGPRYKPKAPGSPFRASASFSGATMSCFMCGKHRVRSQMRTRQLLGKSQTVCAPSCKALDELVEASGAA